MNILKSYKLLSTCTLFLCAATSYGQGNMMDAPQGGAKQEAVNTSWKPSLVKDGVYDQTPHVGRVIPWQPVREADVMWKKRVWREIDTRQKQNMPFRYDGDDMTGGGSFIEILIDAIKKGKVKAYSTADDRFTTALTKDQVLEQLTGKTDTVPDEDPITGEIRMKIIRRDFNPDAVTKYRLKEDWYFDRNLGRMVVRIIGFAPLLDKYNEDGSFRASAPMFWIWYPELREVLVQYEVFNPENDVARMTWDEFFENRYFSSYITKVSNPFDQNFNSMGLQGTDALYEGARVSEQIFNKEHDMWVY